MTEDAAPTGIGGLDYLLRGGLPAHRIHLVEGQPGAGKTTLGLQFLIEGVRRGESCMYLTLFETEDELRANAASPGSQEGLMGQSMTSPIDVSYIADTIFMLRFYEAGGEVRKAPSIVKKRTGNHETTIRDFGVRKNRLHVGEPLAGFRCVLTGVPELVGAAAKAARKS